MIEFITILKDIIFPIFIVMAVGFILQKKFNMDIGTLSKLNIYFVVPGFIFVKLYSTEFSVGLFVYVLLFFVLLIVILYIIAIIAAKILGLDKGKETTFSNSIIFFNSGNYGVPVNDLVFKSDPFAMSIQVIVLTLQNIFTFSYGIFALKSLDGGKWKAVLGYFKMPVLYAMLAGITLNGFNVPIPSFIWVPANYIADAMIALALLTLGAQVARIQFKAGLSSVYSSIAVRLIIAPIIALLIIWIFRIDGIFAQALFIASAMPTSINSAVIAQEYNNHPEFAAQTVLFSTIFSALTVTIVIFLSRVIF
ncbi:AEC family transporter [Oceanobacillus halophilus]|uniref:AEC family transporter n=1 Tax=Oceanobacillus halophilus TaxID=930130 RepID=A0A494ZZB1_9BACI|nr:AEC family transporter [Oceanobacillus halophilus]RKQ32289.1 AEC family transporter [Oceanobacillus halophilus]